MSRNGELAGKTVLHYNIVREIGSGGMGVVYEAEDARLGRRVALKFLPSQLGADPAALERFQREARAASALNHPNICTIYAIEKADGAVFIAMELLEGEPLDRRIASRPLSWDTLVDTGTHMADALDAAHRRGIIHRDIKPGNIFVTTDGRAKILDFGVAKMALQGTAQGETLGEQSELAGLTGTGSTVGTISYMSPEQARGEELDGRTDVFSLSAVLYEMSTGRRAFDGKTTAVVFNKILEAMPTPPREINPTLPPKLEDVILRGLEKDRELRYQSAADLRADLKRLKRDASAGRLAFVPAPAAQAPAPLSSGAVIVAEARRHKGLAAAITLFAVALTAAGAYGVYALVGIREGTTTAGSETVGTLTPERLTTSGDVAGCGAISPEGKYAVYCDFAGNLRLRQIATGATVELGPYSGDTAFSPDSNFVYVTVEDDKANPGGVLLAIPALGGEGRRVATRLSGAAAVSPDGRQVAFVRQTPSQLESAIVVADTRGGNARSIAVSPLGETWFQGTGLSWSPDGRFISATQAAVAGGYRMRPVVVDVQTGKVDMPGSRTWAEVGRTVWLGGTRGILFSAQDGLGGSFQFWQISYPDGHSRQLTNDTRGFGDRSVSVTADGATIATVQSDTISNIWSTDAGATAPLQQWTSGARYDARSGMQQTADGRLFYTSYDGAEMAIWSVDSPLARPRKLSQGYGEVPALPHDGRFLAMQAIHENRFRIWRMDPDGNNARVLSKGEDDIVPIASPDGRWIYYWAAGGAVRIMRMSSEGGEASVVTDLPVRPIDISPDGLNLLVQPTDTSLGASHLVLDATTGAVKTKIDLDDARVGWGRNSEMLTYTVSKKGVSNLFEIPVTGGTRVQLTKFTAGRIFHFAYSPDRTRLFIARGQRTGDIVVLRNR